MSGVVRGIAARAAFLAAFLAAFAVALPASSVGAQALDGRVARDSGATFEQALARIVQRQLQLTDDQLRRLQEVDRHFRERRVANQRDEVQVRRAIRQAVVANTPAASASVDTLIDRFVQLQADRVALVKTEQGELAQFLTPVQRARYLGIQEFLRRRAQELRRGAGPGAEGDSTLPPRRFRRLRP